MSATQGPGTSPRTPATPPVPRARRKWVSHGLSNRIVYGGLHYGARWLPLPVLKTISTVGNSIAATVLRTTRRGMADNFRRALEVPEREATRLARRVFFEYGRATIDVWRMRSEAFTPRITTLEQDSRILAACRTGRGFLLVTGHVGNWEMGAVTLRRNGYVLEQLFSPLVVVTTPEHAELVLDTAKFWASRAELNAALADAGEKVSVNDFIIRALALQRVPAANAVWAEDRILRFRPVDIGVAVAIDAGGGGAPSAPAALYRRQFQPHWLPGPPPRKLPPRPPPRPPRPVHP